MKRKNITPEKAKVISTLLVSIVSMTIVLSVSRMYTKKMLKDAEEEYFNSIHTTLEGFTKIITVQLNNYKYALECFYVDEVMEAYDIKKIINFLIHYDYKKHDDFRDLYLLLPDGTAYLSDGTITYMHTSRHPSLQGTDKYYISDYCAPEIRTEKLFCIEKPIIKDEEIICVLGASVDLAKFMDRTTGIKVGERESFMLLDSEGHFLVHEREEVIGRTFTPQDPRYENTSTINMAKMPATTIISQQDDGNQIYLITSKIPDTGWTLSLKISMNEIDSIYSPEKRNEIVIIIAGILFVLTLVLIEAKVLDFFQRKQLIATVYDPLTNLWTRQRFETEATRIMRLNSRSKYMLVEADIRGFKFINQNYGEDAADKLILYYSSVLSKYCKTYHAIIGRGFADHFYILLKITSVHRAMTSFKDVADSFTQEVKNYEIPFFPKFGIAFHLPSDDPKNATIQSLIGQASFAKSTIKDNLLTQYSVYNSRLLDKINEERYIESHMEQALENHEFFVMYQPKISLSNDKIVGAEALVRWNSAQFGLLTPDKFIPLFERNGFITKLDYYVYEEVFKFIQTIISKGENVVPISVNMSRNHNRPEKFMHDFMKIFNKYSISPNLIQVEILERSVMDNSNLQDITEKLHQEGFTVAMDDFGSGESSLNMLTKIPVDVLKFDREFLNASTDSEGRIDKKSEKFIHILINLSKNLDKQTVFEGVETQAQRDFLRSIECDQAQGFFYSRPLSEQDFVQFIKLHS